MKTDDMSLGQLVQTLKETGYNEKYSWPVDGKIWRMYTKQVDGVLKAAYISDTYDLLSTETFTQLDNSNEEKTAIEGIIRRYEMGVKKIEDAGKVNYQTIGIPTAIGTVLAWARFKTPYAGIFGAMLGYAVANGIIKVKTGAAEMKLNKYLKDHRVKKGDDALEQMLSSYKKK